MASVADLVQDAAQGLAIEPALYQAAVTIADGGRVRLVEFAPLRVVAEVGDGAPVTVVLDAASPGSLEVSADGKAIADWTPVTLAAAVETWRRAPRRRTRLDPRR